MKHSMLENQKLNIRQQEQKIYYIYINQKELKVRESYMNLIFNKLWISGAFMKNGCTVGE